MFKKFKLHDYFENLEPPRYFEISFHVVCFRILYVFVSNILVYINLLM